MSKLKGERAASDIQKELGNILLLEAKDVDFKNVVITGVDVSNDLSYAKVYFTTVDDKEHVTKDLNNAAGFFRTLLSQRVEMRHTPELKFIFDESIAYGEKIENIIDSLHKEEGK
jgi:ribosome-binding factor A